MGVSATDATDNLASFSNNGLAVFLAAPGIDILTTNIGGTYGLLSGTSTSAAIVAGAAAQVKAVDPTLTNGVIVGRLARTADPAGTQAQTGNGRINLARALADTGTDFIEPTGAAPVGGGGPFVGPYRVATTGTVSGTVTNASGGAPISGAAVTVTCSPVCSTDPVSTTTNSSGFYTAAPNWGGGSRSGAVSVAATGFASGGPTSWGPISGGGAATVNFALTSSCTPPSITGQPSAATKTVGEPVTFSVTATGTATLTYQWRKGGVAIGGATSSSYTITSVVTSDAGSYDVVVTNSCGSATSNAASLTVNKATQATLTVNAGSPLTYNTSETLTTSGGSGTGAVSYSVTAGSCSVLGGQLTANSGSGTCSVTATKATDANYNAATSVAATVTLQQATQAISFAPLADKHFGDTDFTVSATGGASGQPVTFTAAGPCTVTGSTVHITGVGSCTITAHQAGDTNYSAAPDVPQSFTITDNTPPDTSVDSGPTSPTNATTAVFTFSGTDNVTAPASLTFECQLDSGGFSACTSPKTYSSLVDGPHTFDVRAIDAAGNVDATPATFNWSVDTAPPDTLIDSMPDSLTNLTTATFTFHATEPSSTFECSLDGGAFATCTSSKTYTGFLDGPHTFDVRAIDPAGNPDLSPAHFPWTVDTLAPDTLIDTHPADPTNSNTPTFTFHASEGSTFSCQLDADPAAACNSGTATYSGLGAGSHTFTVTATDAAHNTDSTPASFTWTIDVTPPDTSITGGPADGSSTTTTSASFDFEGTDNLTLPANLTFECSLDDAAFAGCTSPTSFLGLSRDTHAFRVQAKDAAGNTDPSPATRTWTITKITPVITWANPADITYPTPLSGTQLNATADVAGSFVYTPASGTVLTAGDNQDLKADFTPTDTTNYSTASKTVHINVKKADPTVTFTGAPLTAPYQGTFTVASTTNSSVSPVYTASGVCSNVGTLYTMTSGTGTCTSTVTWAADSNYNGATRNQTTTATKIDPVVTATGNTCTYNGSPCAGSGSATGVGGVILTPVTVAYKDALNTLLPSAPVNAGTYSVAARYAGDANYNQKQSAAATVTISLAPSTTVVSCPVGPYTYTGLPQTPCSATVTGVSGLSLTPTPTYSNNTNAGTATASYNYAGDTNHSGSSGSTTFTINKATPGYLLTPYHVTYDTLPHTATYTITGVNGETGSTVGTHTMYSTHTNAGHYSSDWWSFTGGPNYNTIAAVPLTDDIYARDATVNYIGQLTWVTSGTSTTTAQVTLTASVQDPDGYTLTGATVDFIDTVSGKVLAGGVPVSPVAGSPGTGTANKIVTLSSGQYGSQEYLILVTLNGNYTNIHQANGDKTATVVVSKMAATSETIGGGTMTNLAGRAGTYGITASGQTTFSVGMGYTKSGTNPKGKVSLMIEQTDGSTIYIKSNAITSVAITTDTYGKKNTVIYTKSNVTRVDSSGIATSIDSAVTLRVDAHDGGTTGDTIGFTVLSSTNSTLYYSNDWYLDSTNTWKTKSQSTSGLTIN